MTDTAREKYQHLEKDPDPAIQQALLKLGIKKAPKPNGHGGGVPVPERERMAQKRKKHLGELLHFHYHLENVFFERARHHRNKREEIEAMVGIRQRVPKLEGHA